MSSSKSGFDSWALVELMGHQRIAGHVTEEEIGGSKLLRVDVPASGEQQALTKYFGTAAIYAITPMTEETARGLGRQIDAAPLHVWDARTLLKLPAVAGSRDLEIEDDDEEDGD